jgi:agmatinase
MLSKNVQIFLSCDSEYEESRIVVFGAPFDSTTSFRPGTRFASAVMRSESYGIETYSPYQDLDLEDARVFDGGDLELCFGSPEKALADIEDFTRKILQDGKKPFMIGGEHLVSLGTVRAVAEKYPDLHIVHFDAHTDLRDDYLGARLSHATVMRRIWDIVGDGRIYQFGIRSGMREEFQWARKHTYLHKYDFKTLEEAVSVLKDKPVYFTIDLDVLDPGMFPGTGTPEAGGETIHALRQAIAKVCGLNVVGCDLVELSPHYDMSGASTAVALHAWRELLLSLEKPFIEGPALV